ncbi:enhancer of mRNA-decapping protein 3 isoform X2 [Nymphalis io]|uniref:enhancer of mRNA-decapping protein 3 isoform X2 n=1 Tax=Inachis io TaxID=171585 RepID=UPI002167E2DD|nr:enhancer of mRNA-decapping protein 3 isoform X2 [Nymphalis io]
MSKWIGYAVSVNCGDPLGCYQGTILEADGTTITLTKAFRNGFPYPKSQVTLNAADIKDLKIIEEARLKPAEQTHSTVAVTKNNKKGQRATVCENLQANPSHSGSYGNAGSTPKGRTGGPFHEKARRRNEACFGDMADPALDDDFDFEGNLALFDKQALWEEMRSAARPDVVRAADDAARFRHDENVLGAAPALPAIRLPDELRGPVVYSADDGRRVPSAAPRLRRDFWDAMRRCGLLGAAHSLLARAAADVALRLAGGGRRLEARNAHQAPVAVVLAGAHRAGACGLEAARVLAAHGVRAHVLLASGPAAQDCPELRRELGALALGGVPAHASAAALPAPDVVLLALYDPLLDDAQERHAAALDWVRGARAAVVALEPPAAGWDGVCARASLLAGLPAALPPALGRVYLANVAPPAGLFRELRVAYRPPFGAASVLALD